MGVDAGESQSVIEEAEGYSAYFSPYFVETNNGRYSKHYYAGTQRMASRVEFMPLGMGDEPQQPEQAEQPDSQEQASEMASEMASGQTSGQTELTDENGNASDGNANGEKQPSKEEKEAMREYQKLQQMEVAKVDASGGSESASGTEESEAVEPDLYYYHTDHLGSTSIITDRNGDIAQYLAYIPYGETFIEERNVAPYKFNGKELDQETGYYYYGARYYDPGTVLWFGTDPLAMKNPEVGAYVFCRGNPIVRIDPDGKDDYGLDQESGRLSLLKKTDSDYDIINAGRFDSNNSFIKNNDINSMSVSKGILDGEYFDDISKSGLVVRDNISEGIELVKYISFNTGKELNGWGYESGDEYGIAVSPWSQNRLYKDARGFHNTSVDYYCKGDDRVGYLGVKLLKFHTHPIIKNLVNSGKAIPSNADIKNCDPKFPHYIISQRDNCMIQYKKDKSWSRSGIVIK